jgi:hypothetical protein
MQEQGRTVPTARYPLVRTHANTPAGVVLGHRPMGTQY